MEDPFLRKHTSACRCRVDAGGARLAGRENMISALQALRKNYELVDPDNDPRYREYWTEYHRLAARRGVTPGIAKLEMRRLPSLIGAMLIHMGDADAMLCGVLGDYPRHLGFCP